MKLVNYVQPIQKLQTKVNQKKMSLLHVGSNYIAVTSHSVSLISAISL